MITLVRRIRKKLVDSGSVTKYLLYAMGEILLVVIGILIALQVNNWNEERKNNQRTLELSSALITEFQANKSQLETLLDVHAKTYDASTYLLSLHDNYTTDIPEEVLLDTLRHTYMMFTFDPVNGALRSGISSGDINLLTNDSLKTKLFNWEDLVDDLDEEETRLINAEIEASSFKNSYVPELILFQRYWNEELPDAMRKPDFSNLLRNAEFEHYLVKKIGEIGNIQAELDVLYQEINSIISLLEENIN